MEELLCIGSENLKGPFAISVLLGAEAKCARTLTESRLCLQISAVRVILERSFEGSQHWGLWPFRCLRFLDELDLCTSYGVDDFRQLSRAGCEDGQCDGEGGEFFDAHGCFPFDSMDKRIWFSTSARPSLWRLMTLRTRECSHAVPLRFL